MKLSISNLLLTGLIAWVGLTANNPNYTKLTELHNKIQTMETNHKYEVDDLTCQLDLTSTQLNEIRTSPVTFADMLLSDKDFVPTAMADKRLPGTNFLLYSNAKLQLDKEFYAALLDCNFQDTVQLTSVWRGWNTYSAHYKGKAVDISIHNGGLRFLEWLASEEGKQWVDKYNLKFYIEDNRYSSWLLKFKSHKKLSKNVFLNPKATGFHVHLQINE